MEDKIIGAIKRCLSKDREHLEVYLNSNLIEDLAFDSLDTMMLITELETVFNINIDEGAFENIETVNDIVEKMKNG